MAGEPATDNPVRQDMQAHQRDYSGFTRLFTYGAIAAFVIGMVVLFVIA